MRCNDAQLTGPTSSDQSRLFAHGQPLRHRHPRDQIVFLTVPHRSSLYRFNFSQDREHTRATSLKNSSVHAYPRRRAAARDREFVAARADDGRRHRTERSGLPPRAPIVGSRRGELESPSTATTQCQFMIKGSKPQLPLDSESGTDASVRTHQLLNAFPPLDPLPWLTIPRFGIDPLWAQTSCGPTSFWRCKDRGFSSPTRECGSGSAWRLLLLLYDEPSLILPTLPLEDAFARAPSSGSQFGLPSDLRLGRTGVALC